MKKSSYVLPFVALLCAFSCGGSVPNPNDPDPAKAAKCKQLSEDQTIGCKACAGYPYCGWKQTTDPTTGTCHFLADVSAPPPGVIGDPTHCPKPE
jgi:hypothetical protein